MSYNQFRKPNSFSFNSGSWGQGHPSSYGDPPPYTASMPPLMSDDDWPDRGGFDTPYQEKPGWPQGGHQGSFPMRPGRSSAYPGGEGGWRQHPGMSSGTRCQQCGAQMPMYGQGAAMDEWGWGGREGMGGFAGGQPYGQAQTQQHGTMRCPSCGCIQTPNPYSGGGFQPGGGTFPLAPAEDMYDAQGPYGQSSFAGHHPRATEWHQPAGGFHHGGHQLNNNPMAFQQPRPFTAMGTRDYHRQRHQAQPYSHSGGFDFQDQYRPMDTFDYGNQGMPGGVYPYGMPGMGMQGHGRRGRHGNNLGSYQYSSSLSFTGGGMGPGPY